MIPIEFVQYIIPYLPHVLHLGSWAVAGFAARKVADRLLPPIIDKVKDWTVESVKGEFQAQTLHRTVKIANRVFHFEKHPALTFLSHYLTDENLEAAGAAVVGAGIAEEAMKSFQLGRIKMTTWKEPPLPATPAPESKLSFLPRNKSGSGQAIDVYG